MPDRIKKYKFAVLSAFMICSMFFMNCREDKKHDVLTFFFDGVPPLGQEKQVNADFRATAQAPEGPVWYVHEPRKDCTNCHDRNRQRVSYPQTYLNAPIPKLCYNCHTDFTSSGKYVHGPVAVGQCLFCHNPHASKIKYLLLEPEPVLCFKCHDQFSIELIPAHVSKQMTMCTNCHNPHSSSTRALLKAEPNQINEIYSGRVSRQTNTIPVSSQDKEYLAQIISELKKFVDNGDLQNAETYLIQYKDSPILNTQEKEKITELLKLIDETLANIGSSEISSSEPKSNGHQSSSKSEEIANLYYRSLDFYHTGELIKAKEGFIEVINSGMIPPEMEKTLREYLSDIENKLSHQGK